LRGFNWSVRLLLGHLPKYNIIMLLYILSMTRATYGYYYSTAACPFSWVLRGKSIHATFEGACMCHVRVFTLRILCRWEGVKKSRKLYIYMAEDQNSLIRKSSVYTIIIIYIYIGITTLLYELTPPHDGDIIIIKFVTLIILYRTRDYIILLYTAVWLRRCTWYLYI